jgi:hypothetical protein
LCIFFSQALSAEAWKRRGKQIKKDEQPIKTVKAPKSRSNKSGSSSLQHSETSPEDFMLLNEIANAAGNVDLFGEWQTENFKPEPLVHVCIWVYLDRESLTNFC